MFVNLPEFIGFVYALYLIAFKAALCFYALIWILIHIYNRLKVCAVNIFNTFDAEKAPHKPINMI